MTHISPSQNPTIPSRPLNLWMNRYPSHSSKGTRNKYNGFGTSPFLLQRLEIWIYLFMILLWGMGIRPVIRHMNTLDLYFIGDNTYLGTGSNKIKKIIKRTSIFNSEHTTRFPNNLHLVHSKSKYYYSKAWAQYSDFLDIPRLLTQYLLKHFI